MISLIFSEKILNFYISKLLALNIWFIIFEKNKHEPFCWFLDRNRLSRGLEMTAKQWTLVEHFKITRTSAHL